jgi:hypothetical protein
MQRFVEGWTPAQVRQHRDLFETALRAIDAFVASPRGHGMHADALRFWNHHRSTFHRFALHLGAIPAAGKLPVTGECVQTHAFQGVATQIAAPVSGKVVQSALLVAEPDDEPGCPRCPQCGAVEFSPYPKGSAVLRCAGCHTLWHETDLTGERFSFLRKLIHRGV